MIIRKNKLWILWLILLLSLLHGCNLIAEGDINTTKIDNTATADIPQSAVQPTKPKSSETPVPTITPELTPTKLPTLALKPTIQPNLAISSETVKSLSFLGVIGKGSLYSLDYSPDGSSLAILSSQGITIYNAKTLDELAFYEIKSGIKEIKFSADGKFLLAINPDLEEIQIRTASDFALLRTIQGKCAAISPSGGIVAVGLSDGTVRIELIEDTSRVFFLEGHEKSINDIEFSIDGNLLVTASDDETVRLWNPRDGSIVEELVGHNFGVTTILFSPNNELLVSGSEADNSIYFWQLPQGNLLGTIRGQVGGNNSIAFHPSSQFIAIASNDRITRVFDTKDLTPINRLPINASKLRFSPDGQTFASINQDESVQIWNTDKWKLIDSILDFGTFTSFVVSPDLSKIAASYDSNIHLWSISDGNFINNFTSNFRFSNIQFQPENNQIVGLSCANRDGSLTFWDPLKEEVNIMTTKCGCGSYNMLNMNGSYVLDYDRYNIFVCSLDNPMTRQQIYYDNRGISKMNSSPDGEWIAVHTHEGGVRVINTKQNNRKFDLPVDEQKITSLAFSNNSEMLAAGTIEGMIYIWSMNDRKAVHILNGGTDRIKELSFSPDTELLASVDNENTIRIWETNEGSKNKEISHQGRVIENILFSPDGKLLVTGLADGVAFLWGIP